MNSDQRRRHSVATSKAMKRSASDRRCPKCGRGAALRRHEQPDGVATTCRFCPYEPWFDFYTNEASDNLDTGPRVDES